MQFFLETIDGTEGTIFVNGPRDYSGVFNRQSDPEGTRCKVEGFDLKHVFDAFARYATSYHDRLEKTDVVIDGHAGKRDLTIYKSYWLGSPSTAGLFIQAKVLPNHAPRLVELK